MNNIQVSKEDFAKIGKRLCKQLKTHSSEELSLSETQEQLALAFGFRNYNGINTFFTKEEVECEKINKNFSIKTKISNERVVSKNLNEEQFILILKEFIDKRDMWGMKAVGLIESIIPALIYMREQKEIILDFLAIKEYLIFDNIIKLYKTRIDFPNEIKYFLRDYLFSLPGFQENAPKQNNTVLEQHGYLQMQFHSILLSLIKIDKQNIIILSENILNKFTSINNYQNYSSIMIRPDIIEITKQWENWENSNFLNEEIVNLIMANKSKLKRKNLFIHDLIQLSFNYMDEKKRHNLFNIIFEFINNLTLTKKYSSEVIAIFDK